MDAARAVQIQVVLEGVPLPASRSALIAYAARYDRPAAAELERIPDRSYERIDEVGEALLPRHTRSRLEARLPAPESGAPPGDPDYLDPRPRSGAVRRGVVGRGSDGIEPTSDAAE